MEKSNLYINAISKSLPTGGFKWLDPAKFDLDKYDNDSFIGCTLKFFKIYFEYPKELHKLRNDYSLAADKLEIKREILSDYQLKIGDDYNISIGNVKKFVPQFFGKETYVIHYKNLQPYLRLELKF